MPATQSIQKVLVITLVAATLGLAVALSGGPKSRESESTQAGGKDAGEKRDVYFPGTETLAPDEMRIIACGTGTPQPRLKQAAACFLVQLGNGENFIFDLGAGAQDRLTSLDIDYDHMDKVFIGHLHLDHMGDLPAFFFTGSINGRLTKFRVWGPSGVKPEWGMKSSMEHMKKMYAWDEAGRASSTDSRGLELEVNEFPWTAINQVIYNENGVEVRTIPAVHLDQSVSFILSWKGMKFAYSSDTTPNKWWIKHTQGVDLAIHECALPVELMMSKNRYAPEEALLVGTQAHTPPQAFGKVMDLTRPRRAVAYHFQNDFDTAPIVRDGIRETYQGPLDLATDFMVWNVTKKEIRTRMAVVNHERFSRPALKKKLPPDPARAYHFSELTLTGGEPSIAPIIQKIYDDFNKKHGTNFKPVMKGGK